MRGKILIDGADQIGLVSLADLSLGLELGLAQRGEQHSGQNRDDGDDDQKFD